MTKPLQQINVSLRIIDSDTVEYTYIDPITNERVTTEDCKLELPQPACCLFLLDAETSSEGWTITSIMPNGTAPINFDIGPFGLSVATHCQTGSTSVYRFYIVYYNTLTHLTYFIDPQEQNTPPASPPN